MKKFFLVFAMLFAGMLFAEETVLFNASINSKIEDKAKKDLQEKKRKLEYNTELMHKEDKSNEE